MADDGDFDGQFLLAAPGEPDQLEQTNEGHVEERECRTSIFARNLTSPKVRVEDLDEVFGTHRMLMTTTRGLSLDRATRAKHASIVKVLSELGLALPGSVEVRSTRCGKANCRCKADPAQLHGPYIVWTRKVEARTVTRVLSPEQLEDYRPMFDNAKRLRELVAALQNLALQVVDTDDRWHSR